MPVDVSVNTTPVHKDFALLGPGRRHRHQPDMVVRTEPRDWVDGLRAELPRLHRVLRRGFPLALHAGARRRRPAAAVARARWCSRRTRRTSPASSRATTGGCRCRRSRCTSTAALPPHTQTWAWAHVHINEGFDRRHRLRALPRIAADTGQPERRPDHLPADESAPTRRPNTRVRRVRRPGVRDGPARRRSDRTRSDMSAQQPAWSDARARVELPVYYQWRFRTGENEDFESTGQAARAASRRFARRHPRRWTASNPAGA